MSGGVDDDGHWITLSNTTITLMLVEWAVAMCFATSLLVFSGFPAHITASHDGSFY
jgi:hypothetical protein